MATTFFRKDGWVKTVIGPAVAGAQVYVCAPQPANVSALPPSPLANIFSDVNGLVPITQPIITDGFGHYDYYAEAGLYTEVIGAAGIVQQVYPDQNLGLGNAGPDNPYTAGSNITIVGHVISATIPPVPGVELQTNSVDNTLQTKLNLKNGTGISLTADGAGGVTFSNSSPSTFGPNSRTAVPDWTTILAFFEIPSLAMGNFQATFLGGGSTVVLVPPTSTTSLYARYTSGNTSGFLGAVVGGSKKLELQVLKTLQQNVFIFSKTSLRFWIGLTEDVSPGSGNLKSNNPNEIVVGFRYVAGTDTTWKAYCSTSNVLFTVADTGVTPDITGAKHVYEQRTAQGVPGTVLFLIDGVQVASISTNVPPASTPLTPIVYSESLGSVSGDFGWNLSYAEIFQ